MVNTLSKQGNERDTERKRKKDKNKARIQLAKYIIRGYIQFTKIVFSSTAAAAAVTITIASSSECQL